MTSNFASLHAGLVARKGEASPAVSHPAFTYADRPGPVRAGDGQAGRPLWPQAVRPPDAAARTPAETRSGVRETESERPSPTTFSAPAARKPALRDVRDEPHGRHRLTFRMSGDQRRRLRIAAAQRDQSLQTVLAEALDNHLDGLCACSLSDCACMARDAGQ